MKIIVRKLVFILLYICVSIPASSQIMSCSMGSSYFLCNDGTVQACGWNKYGQLGCNDTIDRSSPVAVLGLRDVISIKSKYRCAIALKSDGTVWTWGENDYGQLGDSTTINRLVPVKVHGLSNVVAVCTGGQHCLALKSDGTVWAWGRNTYYFLGDGTGIDRHVPVQVINLSNVKAIAAGGYFSFAIKNDGTLWEWGTFNLSGELGTVNINGYLSPGPINISGLVAIECGSSHTLALKADGTVWAWGNNYSGQVGDSTNINRYTPVKVHGISNVISIKAGGEFSVALKADGTLWTWGYNVFGALGDGTNINKKVPVQTHNLSGVTAIDAGYYAPFAQKSNREVWAWGLNYYMELGTSFGNFNFLPQPVLNLCYVASQLSLFDHTVSGNTYHDSIQNCVKQTPEKIIPFMPVIANQGNHFSFSDNSGNYSLGINDSIPYTIHPIIFNRFSHTISNPCPASYSLSLNANAAKDTSGFDFGFDIAPCHQLRVDLSANLKRRCRTNFTSVYYVNEGIVAADSVTVHVKFFRYDIPVSASLPFTWDPIDSSIVFNLGLVQPNQDGIITIYDSIACAPFIAGLTECTKAWILPPNRCLLDSTTGTNWDHSSVSVSGSCMNDTVVIVIHNIGTGNMTSASAYHIFENNVITQSGNFQLNAGDSLVISIVSGGNTILLSANQSIGHPGNSHPQFCIEACGRNSLGKYSTGYINQIPQDDADLDIEIDCMLIRDSCDPNEKLVSPEGVDSLSHTVPSNTPLDFVIHFQNTGTDTAYKIVIVDTLSPYLDLATLELGTFSHPYTINLSGQGAPVLSFIFNQINLLDSNTNERLSHGFVKYKIAPLASTPLGAKISNTADIYFDYNFPVHTNTAFVTIGNYSSVVAINQVDFAYTNNVSVYPNPAKDKITVFSSQSILRQVDIFNTIGMNVFSKRSQSHEQSEVSIDIAHLPSGIYFLKVISDKGESKIKLAKN